MSAGVSMTMPRYSGEIFTSKVLQLQISLESLFLSCFPTSVPALASILRTSFQLRHLVFVYLPARLASYFLLTASNSVEMNENYIVCVK